VLGVKGNSGVQPEGRSQLESGRDASRARSSRMGGDWRLAPRYRSGVGECV